LLPQIDVEDDVEKKIINYLNKTNKYIEFDDAGNRKYNDYYVTECIKENLLKNITNLYLNYLVKMI